MSDETEVKGEEGGASSDQQQGGPDSGNEGKGGKDGEAPALRADGKPGWLPEKFKSEADLATSYKELERRQFTRKEEVAAQVKADLQTEREKDMPKAPVDYEFTPIKAGDGKEIRLNPEDPLTKWFQNVAWEMKLSNKQFEKLAGDYIKVDQMRAPDWTKESEALGGAADLRLDRVSGWAKGNLPQEMYDTFAAMPATASMVKMFEHVMTLAGEPAFVPDDSGDGFKEKLTRDDLREMMKDPKYWREKDPRFISQVRAGFRRVANS